MLDTGDLLTLAGVILVGLAVGLAWGWVGVLGFVGAVLVIVGVVSALVTNRQRRTGGK